jgi:hypothetical protein
MNGPYDWDRYPLVPPGCKAIIYKAPAVRGTWASRGTNAWLLGPSKDHYQCNLFYVPKTWAYCILGSAELFPQHCQVPNLSPIEHLKALTAELAGETTKESKTTKGKALLKILHTHLDDLVRPSPAPTEQRVPTAPTTSPTLPLVLQRVSNSPAIMRMWDPMAKWNLIAVKQTHQQTTCNNTPGMVAVICRDTNIVLDKGTVMPAPRRLQEATPMPKPAPTVTFSLIPGRRHPIPRAR